MTISGMEGEYICDLFSSCGFEVIEFVWKVAQLANTYAPPFQIKPISSVVIFNMKLHEHAVWLTYVKNDVRDECS
jgi:hypothetical protein